MIKSVANLIHYMINNFQNAHNFKDEIVILMDLNLEVNLGNVMQKA